MCCFCHCCKKTIVISTITSSCSNNLNKMWKGDAVVIVSLVQPSNKFLSGKQWGCGASPSGLSRNYYSHTPGPPSEEKQLPWRSSLTSLYFSLVVSSLYVSTWQRKSDCHGRLNLIINHKSSWANQLEGRRKCCWLKYQECVIQLLLNEVCQIHK